MLCVLQNTETTCLSILENRLCKVADGTRHKGRSLWERGHGARSKNVRWNFQQGKHVRRENNSRMQRRYRLRSHQAVPGLEPRFVFRGRHWNMCSVNGVVFFLTLATLTMFVFECVCFCWSANLSIRRPILGWLYCNNDSSHCLPLYAPFIWGRWGWGKTPADSGLTLRQHTRSSALCCRKSRLESRIFFGVKTSTCSLSKPFQRTET